ncbi:MAG TPA: hypothetical protein PLB89_05005 [Flavobacteriales bacterium]|nr:hypothetical protein [Flavobacteriales bacterium]
MKHTFFYTLLRWTFAVPTVIMLAVALVLVVLFCKLFGEPPGEHRATFRGAWALLCDVSEQLFLSELEL